MKNHSQSLFLAAGLTLAAASPVLASDAEDMFHKMDTNNDKKVTTLEHAQFCDTMFKQSDADHDGLLSVAECTAAQAAHNKKVDEKASVTHMRLVDTDGDGLISADENAQFSKNGFVRADRNSDGVLTEDEFEDFYSAMEKELKKD